MSSEATSTYNTTQPACRTRAHAASCAPNLINGPQAVSRAWLALADSQRGRPIGIEKNKNDHGRPWTTTMNDDHGRPWTTMDDHGRLWTTQNIKHQAILSSIEPLYSNYYWFCFLDMLSFPEPFFSTFTFTFSALRGAEYFSVKNNLKAVRFSPHVGLFHSCQLDECLR